MKFWEAIQVALSLGAAVRGAAKQMRDEGHEVPEVLGKAEQQAERLEAVVPSLKESLDDYDRFLDRTREMGAGIRVFRVLADGSLDTDADTGEFVTVEVGPAVTKLLDNAMDAVRKDPAPKPVDETPASP